MKIRLWSDLHLECNSFNYDQREIGADVAYEDKSEITLVLAGDIGQPSLKLWDFLHHCSESYKYVIYVIGNHESWDNTEKNVLRSIRKEMKGCDNFYLLHNESVILDGVKFIGTPLYSNTEFDPTEFSVIKHGIMDYLRIRVENDDLVGWRFLNPHDSTVNHENAIDYLEDELIKDMEIPHVVISHWPPTHTLTEPKYIGNSLQNYFCNHDDWLFHHYKIDLWLFGHTHQVRDEWIQETQIVTNARGYGDYEGTGFEKRKVIEI